MEIFFNELSLIPECNNTSDARSKVLCLLETMKALQEHDFNVLRTHDNFYAEDIGNGYTFSSFINDTLVKQSTRLLLRSIVKNPFIPDADSYEAECFILSNYETKDINGANISTEGLASAYIFNSPSISLTGHPHWERDYIPLTIMPNDNNNPIVEDIINVYSLTSIGASSFQNWLQSLFGGIQLNSKDNILLVFPLSQFDFDNRAINDIISWFYDDKRYLKRIKELINDIIINPFTGGKGHTETLAGTGGKASKRIIKKDRIVYTYTQQKITIHQCREHY